MVSRLAMKLRPVRSGLIVTQCIIRSLMLRWALRKGACVDLDRLGRYAGSERESFRGTYSIFESNPCHINGNTELCGVGYLSSFQGSILVSCSSMFRTGSARV